MSEPLTVSLAPTLDVPATRAALASLPQFFRPVPGGRGDVTAVDGTSADWPEQLRQAVESGFRGVLLANPRRVPSTAVALAPDVPVVVGSPWALDPAVLAHRSRIAEAAASAALIDLVSVVPAGTRSRDDVELDQLALVRVAIGSSSPVCRSIVFSGFGTSSTRLSVRSPGEEWRLVFADPAYARPALAYRIDEAGEQLQPTLYETSSRVAWRELHAAVTTGARPAYGLPELAADLAKLSEDAA